MKKIVAITCMALAVMSVGFAKPKKAKGKDVWRPLNLKTTNSYALPMPAVSS